VRHCEPRQSVRFRGHFGLEVTLRFSLVGGIVLEGGVVVTVKSPCSKIVDERRVKLESRMPKKLQAIYMKHKHLRRSASLQIAAVEILVQVSNSEI
jgi:hypothetical protein